MVRLSRHAGLLTTGLLALVVLGPLGVLAPAWALAGLAGLAAGLAGLAQARATTLAARCDKLSSEIDQLSKRLLKVEAVERGPPDLGPLRGEVEEVTVEIGLLGGIVRDLAAVVSSQDGEIERLRTLPPPAAAAVQAPPAPVPSPAPPVMPAPMPAPMSTLMPAAPPLPVAAPAVPVPTAAPVPTARPAPEPAPVRAAPPARRPIPPPARAEAAPETDEAALVAAFDGAGLEVHLQPVVTLPQRKVVAYEALARLRLGALVLPAEAFLPALERHGRTTALDRRMLAQAGTIARHLARRGSEAGVGYGLSPLSLFEPGFLRDLGRMADESPALAGLTLSLPQAGWRRLDAGQRALLGALRGRVGFGLDRPDDLRLDPRDLAALGIGQVKVPAALLLRPGAARHRLSDIAVEDLVPALTRAGLRLVATGVEAEGDVPDLIDLDVPLAQGSAFAPPRPVRGEILAAPPEAPHAPPAPPDPAPERRPFRSVLRRAG